MAMGSVGSFGGSEAPPMADINTTPLVDVMLVLLIIFIVTAPLMTQSIRVDLPRANGAPVAPSPDPIRLSLDAAGRLSWNDRPLADAELAPALAAASVRQPQPEVHLAADKDTRYQRLAEVMGAVRGAGLSKLGFITTPATAAPPTPAGAPPGIAR